MNVMNNSINRDVNLHPGVTLESMLESIGMPQVELAKRTGITTKTINSIIKGSAPISPDTAMSLETVLGEPASYWLRLEADYQLRKVNAIKEESLKSELPFLKKIDVKQMISKGWIPEKKDNVEQLKALYSFFGVSSVNQLSPVWSQLEVNYRTSTVYTQNHFNIMAWLRQGERLAKDIVCKPFNAADFRKALLKCRDLTNNSFESVYERIQNLCADAGVAVVFVTELKHVATSGAAHWIDKDKALIQLSLRGKSDDKFWFNFFHEAGHIILHGRKEQFIDNHGKGLMYSGDKDNDDSISSSEGDDSPYFTEENKLKEAEADEFAGSLLIPRKLFSRFVSEESINKVTIRNFAKTVGVSPGIVVGQLQNKGYVDWSKFNDLKQRYDFPPEFK